MNILEGKKLKSNGICQFQNGWKRLKTWLIKFFTKLIEITQKKLTNGKHEGSPSICSLAVLKVRRDISSIFSKKKFPFSQCELFRNYISMLYDTILNLDIKCSIANTYYNYIYVHSNPFCKLFDGKF